MTPKELRAVHELLNIYFESSDREFSREDINKHFGIDSREDKYERFIRYLRYRKFIKSDKHHCDKISEEGKWAIMSDALKIEADKLEQELISLNATNRAANATTLLSINQRGFNIVARKATILGAVIIGLQLVVSVIGICFNYKSNEIQEKQLRLDSAIHTEAKKAETEIDKNLIDALNNNDTVFVKGIIETVSKKK